MPSSAILNASVIGGNGNISPVYGEYDQGTVVSLTATPDSGYRVNSWSGTDNDQSLNNINTVTMTSDKTVTVKFQEILFENMGFENGNFTYWNTSTFGTGNIAVAPEGLTEGVFCAELSAQGMEFIDPEFPEDPIMEDGSASLSRVFNMQSLGDFRISFDYKSIYFNGNAEASIVINGQYYSLDCNGQINQFSVILSSTNQLDISVNVAGMPPAGDVYIRVDNFQITTP